jgi:hypothetical protein
VKGPRGLEQRQRSAQVTHRSLTVSLPLEPPAEQPLSFGGGFAIPLGEQPVAGLDEQLAARPLSVEASPPEMKQQAASVRVLDRPQLQRGRVPAGRLGKGVQL